MEFADIIFLERGRSERYTNLLGNIRIVLIEELHQRINILFLAKEF